MSPSTIYRGAAAGAGAFVVLAGVAVAGYAVHHPATVTRTVTVTRTAPPKVITRTAPKVTVTVTATPAAPPPSIPCQVIGGAPEPGVITAGLPGDTTCTVTLISPMGASRLAQIQLTAGDGSVSTWNLANPNG
jgi:hypothetical protein